MVIGVVSNNINFYILYTFISSFTNNRKPFKKYMKIYHSYFSFWTKFENKQNYCWVAITKTVPQHYVGNIYKTLAPTNKLFLNTCEHYNRNIFFKKYANYLKTLDKEEILNDLFSFSKNNKDIVLLNWEDLSKESEGRFAYAWLFNLNMKKAVEFDLENILRQEKIKNEIIGNNFLTL